ncbi:ankyrin repeat domain-containing protein, partial [archaeon]
MGVCEARACSRRASEGEAMATASQTELNAALWEAAGVGDGPEVSRLLAAGANMNAVDEDNYTALHEAALEGHAHVVELLLGAGARTDVCNATGNDALHCAIAAGHAALAHRIWCHTRDARFTHAHLAALGYGDVGTEVAFTVEVANAVDGCGYTPLHVAAAVGNADVLTRLVSAGAAVEAADEDGATPLYIACCNGNEACVDAML